MKHLRVNAEIDDLYFRISPLLLQAARTVLPADLAGDYTPGDLHDSIFTLWYFRYRQNPLHWWERFNGPDNHIVTVAKDLGREVVREWRRAIQQESVDGLSEAQECLLQAIEWGASNGECRYNGGVGNLSPGTHTATDEEVQRLFEHVARHNMTDENGTGLGRVESADLMSAYSAAKPAVAHAIRLLASGYGVGEMTNRRAYQQVASVLQVAL